MLRVHKVYRALLAPQVQLVHKDCKVQREFKVFKVSPVLRVLRGRKECRVSLGLRVLRERKVCKVLPAYRAYKESLVRQGLPEHKVRRVLQDPLERQVHKAHKESLVL